MADTRPITLDEVILADWKSAAAMWFDRLEHATSKSESREAADNLGVCVGMAQLAKELLRGGDSK